MEDPTIEELLTQALHRAQEHGKQDWAAHVVSHIREALYWCSERPIELRANGDEVEP